MADVILFLTVGAVVAAYSVRRVVREKRATLRALREAARLAGLADVWHKGTWITTTFLVGRSGRLYVTLVPLGGEESPADTKILVAGLGHEMPGLSVRSEDLGTAVGKRLGAREVEIGDRAFDGAHYVQGPAPLALALLNHGTRARVAALTRDGLPVAGAAPAPALLRDGVLEVLVRGSGSSVDPDRLSRVVTAALEEAQGLVAPADLAARIAENLRAEPAPGVRRRCIATLAREYPDHAATREALVRALADRDIDVRLQAGVALGAEGREALLGIARSEGAPDDTTARAVAALAGGLSPDEASPILRGALRARRVATARECLRALGRHGATGVTTIARVLAVERGELAVSAAEALGITGAAAAEGPLVSALGHPAGDVREAAARALGRVGTSAAVQPLRDLEERDASLRAAARQAIAEIQSRLTGAEHGQLSLGGDEAGQLSIAEEEGGRLSLAEGSGGGPLATGQAGVPRDDATE